MSRIQFIVGNSHSSIAPHRARRSRKGIKKTHDIRVFVDVVNGDVDAIEKVTFDLGPTFIPQKFHCATPVRTKTGHGALVWRFATRQAVCGSFQANIKIRGTGGTSMDVSHYISLHRNSEYDAHHSGRPRFFTELKPSRPFKPMKVPENARFGLELELSSAMHLLPENVANYLKDNHTNFDVIHSYGAGRSTSDNWKIVPDSSIVCSASQPDCNKFELVSPPLLSGNGLRDLSRVLKRFHYISPRLKVNKSMGFHVHIDVSSFSTSQLIKICQQFVKYEEVIDTFMPRSRRSGSPESDRYFQSNRASVASYGHGKNRQINEALENCTDISSLVNLMNRSGRYYKLNMQNLITGRQTTIEFRQHSATMTYEKISYWIRFCILFCYNSAKLQSPRAFKEDSSMEKKFNGLFQFVIKDRALRNYYRKRQGELASGEEDNCGCCTSCISHGGNGGCSSNNNPSPHKRLRLS